MILKFDFFFKKKHTFLSITPNQILDLDINMIKLVFEYSNIKLI
jgi:hypothetical protein